MGLHGATSLALVRKAAQLPIVKIADRSMRWFRHSTSSLVLLVALAPALAPGMPTHGQSRACPPDTVPVEGRFCIDRYEASLVHERGRDTLVAWSPYVSPAAGRRFRAVSRRGVIPQAYISQEQAREACANAGKRLCTSSEWLRACGGISRSTYPYGNEYERGRCNDGRRNPVPRLFQRVSHVYSLRNMNHPWLNRMPNTVARTGSFAGCVSPYGAWDMVGNVHEWVADRHGRRGAFRGGFFVDVHLNGHGCNYVTTAHDVRYHDYSTGFRCCVDLRPGLPIKP